MSQRHPHRPAVDVDRVIRYIPGMRSGTPKRNALLAIMYGLFFLIVFSHL